MSLEARSQWLTPVTLATQEAEIRMLTVRGLSRKIVGESLSQKYSTQKTRLGRMAQMIVLA
jgi:hypothetical protein